METRRVRNHSGGGDDENAGLLNETVLVLVFQSIDWDPRVLCRAACVSRRLRAVAKRLLWRELCASRAPRMVGAITDDGGERLGSGWHALAKLLFFCCGCAGSRHFALERPAAGHLVGSTRFSKTSGRSFLPRQCREDLLFVTDPCEHPMGPDHDDVGVYRGMFVGFSRSRTRACLIGRQAELEPRVRCPYCGARVWSMTSARLVPRSAARRLGSRDGYLEYFVCLHGHLHGSCWLVPLSSGDDDDGDDDDDDDVEEDGEMSGGGPSSSSMI